MLQLITRGLTPTATDVASPLIRVTALKLRHLFFYRYLLGGASFQLGMHLDRKLKAYAT